MAAERGDEMQTAEASAALSALSESAASQCVFLGNVSSAVTSSELEREISHRSGGAKPQHMWPKTRGMKVMMATEDLARQVVAGGDFHVPVGDGNVRFIRVREWEETGGKVTVTPKATEPMPFDMDLVAKSLDNVDVGITAFEADFRGAVALLREEVARARAALGGEAEEPLQIDSEGPYTAAHTIRLQRGRRSVSAGPQPLRLSRSDFDRPPMPAVRFPMRAAGPRGGDPQSRSTEIRTPPKGKSILYEAAATPSSGYIVVSNQDIEPLGHVDKFFLERLTRTESKCRVVRRERGVDRGPVEQQNPEPTPLQEILWPGLALDRNVTVVDRAPSNSVRDFVLPLAEAFSFDTGDPGAKWGQRILDSQLGPRVVVLAPSIVACGGIVAEFCALQQNKAMHCVHFLHGSEAQMKATAAKPEMGNSHKSFSFIVTTPADAREFLMPEFLPELPPRQPLPNSASYEECERDRVKPPKEGQECWQAVSRIIIVNPEEMQDDRTWTDLHAIISRCFPEPKKHNISMYMSKWGQAAEMIAENIVEPVFIRGPDRPIVRTPKSGWRADMFSSFSVSSQPA